MLSSSIFDTLTELATCLCAQIVKDESPTTCFCGLIPGEAPAVGYFADCEEGNGVAYVRLSNAYPSTSIGQQNLGVDNCSSIMGFDVEVGILRFMPVGDKQGNMPTPGEILAATQLQIADMLTMRRAVECCLDSSDYIVGAYTPVGPDGGIVGGSWEINLQVV